MRIVAKSMKVVFEGLVAGFGFSAFSLYRYPYRNSAEGLRSDWKHLRKDLAFTLEQYEYDHPAQQQ